MLQFHGATKRTTRTRSRFSRSTIFRQPRSCPRIGSVPTPRLQVIDSSTIRSTNSTTPAGRSPVSPPAVFTSEASIRTNWNRISPTRSTGSPNTATRTVPGFRVPRFGVHRRLLRTRPGTLRSGVRGTDTITRVRRESTPLFARRQSRPRGGSRPDRLDGRVGRYHVTCLLSTRGE